MSTFPSPRFNLLGMILHRSSHFWRCFSARPWIFVTALDFIPRSCFTTRDMVIGLTFSSLAICRIFVRGFAVILDSTASILLSVWAVFGLPVMGRFEYPPVSSKRFFTAYTVGLETPKRLAISLGLSPAMICVWILFQSSSIFISVHSALQISSAYLHQLNA